MGFFSDLKDDLSQAVNELRPEEELEAALADEKMSEGKDAQDLQSDIITSEELSNMLDKVEAMSAGNEALDLAVDAGSDELPLQEDISGEVLEEVTEDAPLFGDITPDIPLMEEVTAEAADTPLMADISSALFDETVSGTVAEPIDEIPLMSEMPLTEEVQVEISEDLKLTEEIQAETPEAAVSVEEIETVVPEGVINELREDVQEGMSEAVKEESMAVNEVEQVDKGDDMAMDTQPMVATDETAVVTEGMSIIGDVTSGGSLELLGSVTGNIDVLGKLNITGSIQGNSKAAEIYAEGARINGEINSQGSVKIGQSSVIIGNIFANSAVIAGAVKGDIDIHGPVVLDTSAIVMGNIKSKSVQINNGAVIEGMCSQCYAEVNPTSFFEEIKKKKDNKSK